MKIEILSKGNIKKLLAEEKMSFNITYTGKTYSVVEIEKPDLMKLMESTHENSEFNGWYCYSKGARVGSACDFFRVNGHDLIGWSESGKDYHTLLDYLTEELGLTDDEDICDYAVSLAKVNGMNLSKLFKTYEG